MQPLIPIASQARRKRSHSSSMTAASLGSCLLATALGTNLVMFDFVEDITISPAQSNSGTPTSVIPIPAPGQWKGVEVFSRPTDSYMSSLRWSPDNSLLAVETVDGRIFVQDSSGKQVHSLVTNPVRDSDLSQFHRSNLSWAVKSQVLYYVDDTKVLAWDPLLRTVTNTVEVGSGTCALAVNFDSNLLAVSHETGQLAIHTPQSSGSPIHLLPTSRVLNRLEYSFFNHTTFGGSGNDGVLRLWDAASNSGDTLHSFASTHDCPISDMAFSPFNRYLICTVGMDRRYVLYDAEKKGVVKSAVTDFGLTSIAFKSDGVSMAFGTDNGKVLLYDLRSTLRPISSVDSNTSNPITTLHFQGKPSLSSKRHQATSGGQPLKRQNSTGSGSLMDGIPAFKRNVRPLVNKTTPVPEKSGISVGETMGQGRAVSTPDLFTIKRSTTFDAQSSTTNDRLMASEAPPKAPQRPLTAVNLTSVSLQPTTSDVLKPWSKHSSSFPTTPVRDLVSLTTQPQSSSPYSFQAVQQPRSAASTPSTASLNSPPRSPLEASQTTASVVNSNPRQLHQHMTAPQTSTTRSRRRSFGALMAAEGAFSPGGANAMTDERIELLKGQIVEKVRDVLLSPPLNIRQSSLDDIWMQTTHQGMQHSSTTDGETVPKSKGTTATGATATSLDTEKLVMQTNQRAGGSSYNINNSTTTNTTTATTLTSTPPSSLSTERSFNNFQTKILESTIQDCLSDFKVGLRADIQNMHLELLRQFQIQKTEIESLLRRYTDKDVLMERIAKLEEENRRLRASR